MRAGIPIHDMTRRLLIVNGLQLPDDGRTTWLTKLKEVFLLALRLAGQLRLRTGSQFFMWPRLDVTYDPTHMEESSLSGAERTSTQQGLVKAALFPAVMETRIGSSGEEDPEVLLYAIVQIG